MEFLKSILKHTAFAIAMIGAINWGLIGFFNFEIFSYFFGSESYICKIIYIIIGICALFSSTYAVIDCKNYCNNNDKNKPPN